MLDKGQPRLGELQGGSPTKAEEFGLWASLEERQKHYRVNQDPRLRSGGSVQCSYIVLCVPVSPGIRQDGEGPTLKGDQEG